jgi:hypothetical protein
MTSKNSLWVMVWSSLLSSVLCAPLLQAEVITFEGVAPAGGSALFASPPPYIEKGFEFSGGEDFRVLSNTIQNYQIDNGSDNGFNQTVLNFTIRATDGKPFAITCIDLGQAFGAAGGVVSVTGLGTSGSLGVVSNLGLATGVFFSFELSPLYFTNMLRVDVSHTANFLAIDNVCLEKRHGLWADGVTAMLPTQFSGSEFQNGTTKVVGEGVEFSNRYFDGDTGIDLDFSETGFTFTFFNNRDAGFNPGLTGLELTDLDLVLDPTNPINGVTLEPGSTFPAGTFDNVTIGPDSIVFALPNINMSIQPFQVWTATFTINAKSDTVWADGFEDPPVPEP